MTILDVLKPLFILCSVGGVLLAAAYHPSIWITMVIIFGGIVVIPIAWLLILFIWYMVTPKDKKSQFMD